MQPKFTAKNYEAKDIKPKVGLVDGGHTILECSSCGRSLIDIFHTQPKAIDPRTGKPFEWKMQAICCFCKDHSDVVEIKGKFKLGGYGKIKEDDESQDIPETFPDGIEEIKIGNENILVVKTVKA